MSPSRTPQARREEKRRRAADPVKRERDAVARRARLRWRYRNDPDYKLKCKIRAIEYSGRHPNQSRAARKAEYWKNPELNRRKSLEWYRANRERRLESDAARRDRNRDRNRADARWHSANLTDRYVREQLSKYSDKSMQEWTAEQVTARRERMLMNRAKKMTPEKVAMVRRVYAANDSETVFTIAAMFKVSPSLIHGIVINKWHVDVNYTPPRRIRAPGRLRELMQFLNNTAATMKAIANEARVDRAA